jgi:hypothetical protein
MSTPFDDLFRLFQSRAGVFQALLCLLRIQTCLIYLRRCGVFVKCKGELDLAYQALEGRAEFSNRVDKKKGWRRRMGQTVICSSMLLYFCSMLCHRSIRCSMSCCSPEYKVRKWHFVMSKETKLAEPRELRCVAHSPDSSCLASGWYPLFVCYSPGTSE